MHAPAATEVAQNDAAAAPAQDAAEPAGRSGN